MAKTLTQSVGRKGLEKAGAKSKTKSEKPKRLSKVAEWWLANPDGIGVTHVDMRAVMK